MNENEFGELVKWLRADVQRLFEAVDKLEEAVTRQVARCDVRCAAVEKRELERARAGDRWWGFGFRLLGQAVVAVVAVVAGLVAGTGKWPW